MSRVAVVYESVHLIDDERRFLLRRGAEGQIEAATLAELAQKAALAYGAQDPVTVLRTLAGPDYAHESGEIRLPLKDGSFVQFCCEYRRRIELKRRE